MTKLSGVEIVAACLKEQDADTVFDYPGGAILNTYDALYKHRDEIRHVLTSHEQGTIYAVDGYTCMSGKVGVCLAASDPGAMNLVAGVASVYMDSLPIAAIACNVASPILGKDSFQEIDVTGISMSITEHNLIVKDVWEFTGMLRHTFRITRSDHPGPVLVDITKDVTAAVADYEVVLSAAGVLRPLPAGEKVEGMLAFLKAAKKPYIMTSGGMILSSAMEALTASTHCLDAPVCCTSMSQRAFNQNDPLYTDMIGMHGTKISNYMVSDCDLLVVVGARFSDRVAGSPKQLAAKMKILQIDTDEAEVNRNIHVAASLAGDVMILLIHLTEKLPARQHTDWVMKIQVRKERFPLQAGEGLTGPRVIRELDRFMPDDAIVVTEIGQYRMWVAQYYTYYGPRIYLTSGGLGAMGFGPGTAIGAQTAKPNNMVMNVTGDGCLHMNMNELATVAREGLPLIGLIVDNHAPGMVRRWQTFFYEQCHSSTVLRDRVDYYKVIEAVGIRAYHVTTMEELWTVLRKVVESREAAVLDVLTDSDEKVFPMCSPDADLKEVLDESDL